MSTVKHAVRAFRRLWRDLAGRLVVSQPQTVYHIAQGRLISDVCRRFAVSKRAFDAELRRQDQFYP